MYTKCLAIFAHWSSVVSVMVSLPQNPYSSTLSGYFNVLGGREMVAVSLHEESVPKATVVWHFQEGKWEVLHSLFPDWRVYPTYYDSRQAERQTKAVCDAIILCLLERGDLSGEDPICSALQGLHAMLESGRRKK